MNSCLRNTFTFSKACEVFLHHLRNSTGPKDTPLKCFRLCETFFEKQFFTDALRGELNRRFYSVFSQHSLCGL